MCLHVHHYPGYNQVFGVYCGFEKPGCNLECHRNLDTVAHKHLIQVSKHLLFVEKRVSGKMLRIEETY